jgi:hypothetical protein
LSNLTCRSFSRIEGFGEESCAHFLADLQADLHPATLQNPGIGAIKLLASAINPELAHADEAQPETSTSIHPCWTEGIRAGQAGLALISLLEQQLESSRIGVAFTQF